MIILKCHSLTRGYTLVCILFASHGCKKRFEWHQIVFCTLINYKECNNAKKHRFDLTLWWNEDCDSRQSWGQLRPARCFHTPTKAVWIFFPRITSGHHGVALNNTLRQRVPATRQGLRWSWIISSGMNKRTTPPCQACRFEVGEPSVGGSRAELSQTRVTKCIIHLPVQWCDKLPCKVAARRENPAVLNDVAIYLTLGKSSEGARDIYQGAMKILLSYYLSLSSYHLTF